MLKVTVKENGDNTDVQDPQILMYASPIKIFLTKKGVVGNHSRINKDPREVLTQDNSCSNLYRHVKTPIQGRDPKVVDPHAREGDPQATEVADPKERVHLKILFPRFP